AHRSRCPSGGQTDSSPSREREEGESRLVRLTRCSASLCSKPMMYNLPHFLHRYRETGQSRWEDGYS
ncbi:hypothetical protein XENORESO_000530, partial [Xenotaenia resolanae]